MFCIHCGKEIEDDSKYCIYCGFDVRESTVGSNTYFHNGGGEAARIAKDKAISLTKSLKAKLKKIFHLVTEKCKALKGRWIMVGITCLVLLVTGIIMAITLRKDDDEDGWINAYEETGEDEWMNVYEDSGENEWVDAYEDLGEDEWVDAYEDSGEDEWTDAYEEIGEDERTDKYEEIDEVLTDEEINTAMKDIKKLDKLLGTKSKYFGMTDEELNEDPAVGDVEEEYEDREGKTHTVYYLVENDSMSPYKYIECFKAGDVYETGYWYESKYSNLIISYYTDKWGSPDTENENCGSKESVWIRKKHIVVIRAYEYSDSMEIIFSLK